jgi:hypothetical protein
VVCAVAMYTKDQLPSVSPSRAQVNRESAGSHLEDASERSQKLAAEAGDSWGTKRKGNIHHWEPLPRSAVKTVTENTSLCETVICEE